jgi:hypothetical protein
VIVNKFQPGDKCIVFGFGRDLEVTLHSAATPYLDIKGRLGLQWRTEDGIVVPERNLRLANSNEKGRTP